MKLLHSYFALILFVLSVFYPTTVMAQRGRHNLPKKTTTPAKPAFIHKSTSLTVAKVVAVQGKVTVTRTGLKKPITASRNMQLFPNDILIVADNSSSVTVFCLQDFSQKDWSEGEHKIECPPVLPPAKNKNKLAVGFIKARDQSNYINDSKGRKITRPKGISPQYCLSAIIKSRPAIWGTSISMKDNDALLSSSEVEDLEKRLVQLLKETDPVSQDARNLIQVDLHALYQDYDGAIGLLTDIKGSNDDPYIQLMLGDLYCAGGYSKEGKDAYMQAAIVAEKKQDILAQAVAHHAVGYFQSLVEELPVAKNKEVHKAISLYKAIGDDETADHLKSQLQAAQSKSK